MIDKNSLIMIILLLKVENIVTKAQCLCVTFLPKLPTRTLCVNMISYNWNFTGDDDTR